MNKNLSERAKNGKTGQQFIYVLDCINNSSAAYDSNKVFNSDYERVAFVLDNFKKWDYRDNKIRIPNLCERLGDWLRGLPSYIKIDFENAKIIEIGISWGYCQTERKKDDFLNYWFNMVAHRLLQIAEKVGYNTFNL